MKTRNIWMTICHGIPWYRNGAGDHCPFIIEGWWLFFYLTLTFSDSVEGANASAVVYTMVEMAKAHDLNIYGYLKFLLERRPTKEMTDDQMAELAPWSEKLQSIKNRM